MGAVGREVEGHPPLAAVPHNSPLPFGITAGRFDADDVGAVVGEQHGRHRPGDAGAQVEHPHPVEDPVHVVWSLITNPCSHCV
jgi:hypothetical protein